MDQGRLELYDMLKPKLDEEPARRLVLALPAHPDQLVTKDHLESRLEAKFNAAVATLTWRMVLVVGAWTTIAMSLFAFMSNLL